MPGEVWSDISGFEGVYQVSDLGNIRGTDREVRFQYGDGRSVTRKVPGGAIKSRPDAYGYRLVTLCRNGKPFHFKVHRIVASAFVANPRGEEQVDHIDGNRSNNAASNLRWSCPQKNRWNLNCEPRAASGVRGVRFREGRVNPWQAYGKVGDKFRSLGHYPTLACAAEARKAFEDGRWV